MGLNILRQDIENTGVASHGAKIFLVARR